MLVQHEIYALSRLAITASLAPPKALSTAALLLLFRIAAGYVFTWTDWACSYVGSYLCEYRNIEGYYRSLCTSKNTHTVRTKAVTQLCFVHGERVLFGGIIPTWKNVSFIYSYLKAALKRPALPQSLFRRLKLLHLFTTILIWTLDLSGLRRQAAKAVDPLIQGCFPWAAILVIVLPKSWWSRRSSSLWEKPI